MKTQKKNLIWSKEKIFLIFFKNIFEMQKQTGYKVTIIPNGGWIRYFSNTNK
jgi:hypothetical protein